MRPYPIGNGTVTARVPREFAALMDALQLKGANTDALLALNEAEWDRIIEFCDLSHLTLSLSQVQLGGLPARIVQYIEKCISSNAQRFELVRSAYLEAAAALGQAGVAHVVLKGFTQAPDFVSDPRLRMQSDIDLYCPKDAIESATFALTEIGYASVKGPDYSRADHLPSLSRLGDWKWRGNMYDPEMPPGIELHFCMWNNRSSLIELPQVSHFWGRRIVRKIRNLQFVGLNPVDQLGYFTLHILRGVITGDWVVHHVHELATFLHERSRDVQFWNEWQIMHDSELRKLEVIACCLARDWFSCALSEVVRTEADGLPETQKMWLGRYSGAPLEVMFRRNKDGQLLHLLLTNSATKRQSLMRKAFTPRPASGAEAYEVRFRNRRPISTGDASPHLTYVKYLVTRSWANLRANAAMSMHAASLWLSTRGLRSQFWLFLGASFFLTWACQFTSSSSTFS